jgi:ubiquinone/menaquinone biosynthesis C-methylase UbiE
MALEQEGEIRGRVLDVGCGTGENALFYAARGHETWAIDFAPLAIQRAREKGSVRAANVRFEVASALELGDLGESFDTVTDCGMFHTFSDEHRPRYSRSLASVLRPGGRLFVLCFSEREPTDWGGPRRVTEPELRATFDDGWKVRWIRAAQFETTQPQVSGHAWMASFERRGPPPPPPPRPSSRGKPVNGRRTGESGSSVRPTSPPRNDRTPRHRSKRAN